MNRLVAALYDQAMAETERACLSEWRRDLLSVLEGRVLEIGAGTGANLAFYPPAVTELVLSEPDRHMRRRLAGRRGLLPQRSAVIDASAEHLPFPDGSFDAAVSTLVLCSVDDPSAALSELRRVLRPEGSLLLIEHVGSDPVSRQGRWQRRLEPAWRRLAGNCHVTRDTAAALATAGFDPAPLIAESLPKAPFIVRPMIRGLVTAS